MREKTTAIVLAAGQGKRMKSKTQKQFLELEGYPVLYYSLKCFQDYTGIDEIVLVTGKEEIEYSRTEIAEKYSLTKVRKIIPGGKERYDSVYQGLLACEDAKYVLVHDGARPFVTAEILERVMSGVREYGACIAAVPSKDTVKLADDEGCVDSTPPRERVWNIQTPQAFEYGVLRSAHEKIREKDLSQITDDAMVVEQEGECRVKLEMGGYENLKITTPDDLEIARSILRQRERQKKERK